MITTAPLPHWRHLLARAPAADDQALAAPWARPGDHALWFGRGAWGLRAMAEAWAATHGRPLRLMVPEFFCAQSLWPLRHGPAEIAFHPVDEDGHPLWEALGQDFDALLLVHLFGRPARTELARAACDRAGALLIEDGAHALGPAPGMGNDGDLVLYSPHKLLAVPDGAVVLVRPRAAELIPALTQARDALGGGGLSGNAADVRPWLAKRLLQASQAGPLLQRLRPGGQADFLADPEEHAMAPEAWPSALARRLLAQVDLTAAAARRRANQAALVQALADLPGWRPFAVPEQAAPYRAVFRCDDEAIAVRRYDACRRAGLPVESWPDLPAPARRHDCAARRLRRSLLCLPCHQSLRPAPLAAAYAAALERA